MDEADVQDEAGHRFRYFVWPRNGNADLDIRTLASGKEESLGEFKSRNEAIRAAEEHAEINGLVAIENN